MPSFLTYASMVAAVAGVASALPYNNGMYTPAPTSVAASTIAPAVATASAASSSSVTVVPHPPASIGSYQMPPVFPTGGKVIAPAIYFKPDPKVTNETSWIYTSQQIGSDVVATFNFDASLAGKTCKWHFAISGAADGFDEDLTMFFYEIEDGVYTENFTTDSEFSFRFGQPVMNFDVDSATQVIKGVNGSADHDFFPGRAAPATAYGDPASASNPVLGEPVLDSTLVFACPTEPKSYGLFSKSTSKGFVAGTKRPLVNWSWGHGLLLEACDSASACAPTMQLGNGTVVVGNGN